MNNQMPFGFNPNMQPNFPGMNNFSNQTDIKLENIEQRLNILENKIRNIESKLSMTSSFDSYSTSYNSNMHMM